jgi:flagellar motor switch protein FliM
MSNQMVGLYDFKRPDRVSKEQIRTLQNLHEGFARLFSTTLTSYLRTLVEIELLSVDQLTYQEVTMSISTPSCIYIFEMEPLEGNALMEINPSLVYLMLDRLFGGVGRNANQNRELTGIERAVINKITERALSDLKEVWENIGIFSPKIDSYETNPQFVQIAPPGETVILISLQMNMKNGSGLMSLCFPFIMLESIIEKLTGETWIAAQKTTTQETRRIVERELSATTATVACRIGEMQMSVRDFLQLRKGDVLVIDKQADSDLTVYVEGRPKFLGRPGVVGRDKSVQITGVIEREVGDYDE